MPRNEHWWTNACQGMNTGGLMHANEGNNNSKETQHGCLGEGREKDTHIRSGPCLGTVRHRKWRKYATELL